MAIFLFSPGCGNAYSAETLWKCVIDFGEVYRVVLPFVFYWTLIAPAGRSWAFQSITLNCGEILCFQAKPDMFIFIISPLSYF